MKTLFFTLTAALLCATAVLADVARPVLQSSTTKALVDDLATGAKKMTVSATGTLEWVNGGTMSGASYFRTAAGLGIGVNVQAYDADLTTWAGISPSANVQTLLGASNYAAFKTSLSLNNVENTALSTFAGTANMTTLGTITTGVWHGTAIGLDYLAAGGATDGQLLGFSDGEWIPVTFGLGLTVGTTSVSGGTSGRLLMNNGGLLGELALGTGVATALGNAVNASGGVLTYGLIGTSGTKLPLLDAANTFASAQRFGGASGDYIALASSGTRELRLSSNAFSLGSSAWLLGMYDSGSLSSTSGSSFFFESTAFFRGDAQFYGNMQWTASSKINNAYGTYHAILYEGTNAQRWSVMNTYSSGTNYEAGVIDWQTTANTLRMGSEVGSGGGTARDVQFIRGGVVKQTFGANTTDHEQPVKLKSYIVSGLPSASTCGAGSMAFVTDATTTTAYSTVAGGGSNKVLVISDGTNWIIH